MSSLYFEVAKVVENHAHKTLVFIAITAQLSVSTKREQRRWIEMVQERLRSTTKMLGNIKAVKMLGLSDIMSKVIGQLRADEIRISRGFRVLLVVRVVLCKHLVVS